MKRSLVWAVLVAAAGVPGCASSHSAEPSPEPGSDASPRTSSERPSAVEQAALVDSVRSTYTPADVAFMSGMIHHHAQALVMSRMAPTHGASPQLQVLAGRIINAQRDEIALMQRWLRERGEDVPEPPEDVPEPGHEEHAHADASMPGMLTPEELAKLDDARGEEFDRLFLSLMIRHHQGAITMVDELVASPGGAREESVFKLASDIAADQASEITRMQTMLRDLLFGADSPP